MKTKISIISGFLGAGKTTFIMKLMKDLYPQEKVVILENEFGRINIDKETLGREGLKVKPIQAGCICCSSSMDLSKGVREIIEEYNPRRILVEPTGIAKLSEIKRIIFDDEALAELCEIEHIITIVDAKNYYHRTLISKVFFEDQIKASKIIFLNKTKDMEEEKILEVKNEIRKIQPNCLVVAESWEHMSPKEMEAYLNETVVHLGNLQKMTHHSYYKNDFGRYEIVKEDPIDIPMINDFIRAAKKGEFGEVHRIKGICYDAVKGAYTIDYLPGESILKPIENHHKMGQSQICFIGRNLKKDKLAAYFKKQLEIP